MLVELLPSKHSPKGENQNQKKYVLKDKPKKSTNKMKTKIILLIAALGLSSVISQAALTFDFTGNSDLNGSTPLNITLSDLDTGIDTIMTITPTGGSLDSNSGDYGIDGTEPGETNDQIDGIIEAISLSFDKDVDILFLDFGGIGNNVADGAGVTFGSFGSVNLFTGVTDFNGSQDIYTPTTPIRILSGENLVMTGSSETSSYDLETMSITVIPEPSSIALMAMIGLAAVTVLRKLR